eukprot:TRINITY_DN6181_c0_g2_i1.p1 TRINITY_DN6181_c0_g2~~TRINITY_DN6181_c0_g2_i1.p1  ORF type:complete len:409 (+),score=77.00 TRINITY_DN6181_c0_g2_i1:23-1228(+)
MQSPSWAARRAAANAAIKNGKRVKNQSARRPPPQPDSEAMTTMKKLFPPPLTPWMYGTRLRMDSTKVLHTASEAMRTFYDIKSKSRDGVPLDVCNMLLMYYSSTKLTTFFNEVWGEMASMGIEPDLTSYNQKLHAVAVRNTDSSKNAVKILEEMKQKGLTPNDSTRLFATKALVIDGAFETALRFVTKTAVKATDRNTVLMLLSGSPDMHRASLVMEQFGLDKTEDDIGKQLLLVCRFSKDLKSAERVFHDIKHASHGSRVYLSKVYEDSGELEKLISLLEKIYKPFTTHAYMSVFRCASTCSEEERPARLERVLPFYHAAKLLQQARSTSIFVSMLRLAGADTVLASSIHHDLLENKLKESASYRKSLQAVFDKAGTPHLTPAKRSLAVVIGTPGFEART